MNRAPAIAIALSDDRGSVGRRALERAGAYLALTKPRVTVLILLIGMAGFWLGSKGMPDARRLFDALGGIGLLAGGIFALNQYLERGPDGLMQRTAGRPLPSGRLRPLEALAFGAALSVMSVAWLAARTNAGAGALAAATLVGYVFLYTPLKRKTPHCTLIGALPGAVPPLLGWVAAGGGFNAQAWTLFAILFFWQFPHFHAIAWLYREDYTRADVRMWPVVEPDGRTTCRQIVAAAALLLPVSLLPVVLGVSGAVYLCGAMALGGYFLHHSLRTALGKTKRQAQSLLLASVLYLPALFLLMVLNKA